MMIWPKTGIPKSSLAALSRFVMVKSSADGTVSPDGWSASMIDSALVRMAGLKTSLGYVLFPLVRNILLDTSYF